MIKIVFSIVFSLTIGIVLAELLLQFAGISYPSFFGPDEYRGTALRPNTQGMWTREGRAFIHVNSEGLRDLEHDKNKAPRVFRVAVLGDSYAEALQVDLESTFWTVMVNKLRNSGMAHWDDVEVINFGVSGYGTAQELLTLKHFVWQYDPDLILLSFLAANDVADNTRELANDPKRPYFLLDENGALVLDDAYLQSDYYRSRTTWYGRLIYSVINRSRFLQLANEVLSSRRAMTQARQNRQELGTDYNVFRSPVDEVWQRAWAVTDALLVEISNEAARHGVPLIVSMITSGFQVHPDPAYRNKILEQTPAEDLGYPYKRISALGSKHGFEVIDLAPDFARYAEENQIFLHGFDNTVFGEGHWNEEGHRRAGEIIAPRVKPYLDMP